MRKSKILVCVIDSESSRVAFQFCCAKAKALGIGVEALTIIDNIDLQNPFTSETTKREEASRAEAMFQEYHTLAASKDYGIELNFSMKIGDFEETVIKTINADSSIIMLILGYSVDGGIKHSHAVSLLSKLGKSLMIPITIVPGNLTNSQILELNGLAGC